MSTTWNRLFAIVGPLMMNEAREGQLRGAIQEFVKEEAGMGTDGFPQLRGFEIAEEDFQRIKVQFRALGMMVQSTRPHAKDDPATYWTLTPYGNTVVTSLVAVRRSTPTPRRQAARRKS